MFGGRTGGSDGALSRSSRVLTVLDRVASRPLWGVAVLAADGSWLVYSVVTRFPDRIEAVFQSVVAALTLAMVFVIQHTQSRQQIATQRKLDEILRALPTADNAVISLEHASDRELHATGVAHRRIRRAAVARPDRRRET